MLKWEIQLNEDDASAVPTMVPDYLDKYPDEIIGNVMHSVMWLLNPRLGLSNNEIISLLDPIQSSEHRKDWSTYFRESIKQRGITIH